MINKIKILHLEDSENDALLISRFLQKSRHNIAIRLVEKGIAFKQALETEQWDIILSDYALPEYSGMDAIALVKSLGIDIPFILVSGAIGEEIAVELMHKGAADYIMKDNLSRLLPAIERELLEVEFRKKSKKTDAAMQSMVKSIVGTYGEECFEKILNGLCEWVGAESGMIGTIYNDHIHTISCIIDGITSDGFQYAISGSPCNHLIKEGFSIYTQNLAAYFPEDKNLEHMGIESFVGIPLKSSTSETIGVLCIFSKKELEIPHRLKEYMEIVSAKIVSELERQNEEKKRLGLESQLRQAQKMEAIGTLAGGIAHDFNNILFPILGHSEMLLEDLPKNTPAESSARKILSSALRAKDLVHQILTFSRQEKSNIHLMKLQPVLKESLKMLRSTIPSTIDIRQNIDPGCSPVKADPIQIHQIIMNLTTNAYHAMENSGGMLNIELKETDCGGNDLSTTDLLPGRYVCLTVRDTGIGMSEETIEKIFDPFFTTKKTGKGTGIGLSVVHGIVTEMKAAIRLNSKLGEGSEFIIYFPIEKNTTDEKKNIIENVPLTGQGRILLIDDEAPIVNLEKLMLERLGYQVCEQTSSIDAFEMFKANPGFFDLVISDMTMPNMTGEQLALKIHEIRQDIPIIICSGFSDRIGKMEMKKLGIKGLLMKPVRKSKLANTVRMVLEKK